VPFTGFCYALCVRDVGGEELSFVFSELFDESLSKFLVHVEYSYIAASFDNVLGGGSTQP